MLSEVHGHAVAATSKHSASLSNIEFWAKAIELAKVARLPPSRGSTPCRLATGETSIIYL